MGVIWGLYRGYVGINGKEHGNYYLGFVFRFRCLRA